MNAILGVFPKKKQAQRVIEAFKQRGLVPAEKIALLTREEIGRLDKLLSEITPAKPRTKTGLIVGLVTGGILGLVLGTTLFPMMMTDMDVPAYTFGLLGMLPFAALGAYLGSLYGSRSATRRAIRIKERLGNDDAVLVIARPETDTVNTAIHSMESAGGAWVSADTLPESELKRIFK